MSSVDKRVVEMEFDNKQFENGIKDTLNSLEDLKKGLELDGATKGLQNIEAAGKNFSLQGIADGVDHIASRFNVLGAVGFTIIQNLTNSALEYAKKISGLVLDPLVAGGKRRAENIEQAKFQFRGLGMDIKQAMEDALYGVKDTAYGLDTAAKAASQLGASQVALGEDMKAALRGISGVAAMTNSSYEDTARVFTRVAGQGRVMAVDLNSLAARGLNAAATLADAFGVTEAEIREMVTEGKVSFDMFSKAMNDAFGENATKANETYAGSLSNLRAALSRIGAGFFTTFLEQQRDLFNELTPAVDAVGDALKPVIDMMLRVTGARNTGLSDFLGNLPLDKLPLLIDPILGIVENLYDAFVSIAKPIKEAFGQIFPPSTIEEIGAILSAIESFTETIKMGAEGAENLRRTFAGIFAVFSIGWTVVKAVAVFLFDLFGMVSEGSGGFLDATANIGDFLVALDHAIKNGEGLTQFFERLSGILKGPIEFIKELGRALLSIFDFDVGSLDQFALAFEGNFEPLARLGEIIVSIWGRMVESFKRVFGVLQPVIDFMERIFGEAGQKIAAVFEDLNFDQILDVLNTGLLVGILAMFRRFADNLSNSFGSIQYNLTEPFRRLTFALSTMQNTLRAMTLMQIAIAIALLAGSVLALSKVDNEGLARALTAMTAMFTQLMLALKGFTMIGGVGGLVSVGAGLILFALAIRILTSSVKALAELEWEDLAKGLTGVTVLVAALTLAVKGMSGHTGGMISTGAGLLILAAGIKVLASAVTDLSGLSWEEMARGLVGVGTLLGALTIFTRLAAVNKGGLAQGAGIILLATGIKILASAAEDFAGLSWGNISKGLVSITAILTAFALFSKAMGNPAGLIRAGASLVLIGAAMKILASAMGDFGNLSWEEIGKGLASMAGALAGIALALNLMPPSTLASAAALVVVGAALKIIASAVQDMGGMTWEEIGKGLTTLAGALLIISVAMLAMTTALPGAAATLVVAAALRMLAPVLETFGGMTLGEIARGLGVLAGAFAILGLAALILTPVVPVLLSLGGAVMLLGAGMLLAGAGVLAFASGLTALAAAGAAGTAAIVAMVAGLIGLLPLVAKQIGVALIVFADVIAGAGPAIAGAIVAVLGALIDAIVELTPKITNLFGDLMLMLVEKITEIVPQIASAAYGMMVGILEAMNEHVPNIVSLMISLMVAILEEMRDGIPGMVTTATELMVAFLESMADNLSDVITAGAGVIIALIEGISENMVLIVEAGIEAIINFINGVAQAIRDNTDALHEAGRNLAGAIVSGLTGGLSDKVGAVARSAGNLAQSAIDSAKAVLDSRSPSKEFEKIGNWVAEGFADGIQGGSDKVDAAWQMTMNLLQSGMESSARTIEQLEGQLERLGEAKERDIEKTKDAERALAKLKAAKDQDAYAIEKQEKKLLKLNEASAQTIEDIKETKSALSQAKDEFEATKNTITEMNHGLKDQKRELDKLAQRHDIYTDKLDKANQKLEDAIKTRDDYKRSLQEQYKDLPDISEDTNLEGYINDLQYANADLEKFTEVIQELRKRGLSDALYEEFLAKGPDILPFLEELLAGGEESLKIVNDLSTKLERSANKLGVRASRELYQAGVSAAHGLVSGLRSKKKAVEAEAAELAEIIQKVIELKLKIKSPSKITQRIGEFTGEGLALGMKKTVPAIEKAASGVADSAVDAMKKSISEMSDLLMVDTDLNPTITPILDLDAFRRDAAQISSTLSAQQIDLDAAYSKAKYASRGYQANKIAADATTTAEDALPPAALVFNQYNNSPKALSSAEIYRQTKNQLSVTKGALTPDAAQDA